MPGKIFVNYRRDDERSAAARVRDRLATAFGGSNVFMDVDNLMAGQRFDRELERALAETDIFLAVMGPRWMDLFQQRLASGERDYVREEIAAALKRGIVVIPVLIERAALPRGDDLPDDIRELVLHQKHTVVHEQFGRDVDGLIEAIRFSRKPKRGLPSSSTISMRRVGWPAAALVAVAVVAVGVHQGVVPVPTALWPPRASAVDQAKRTVTDVAMPEDVGRQAASTRKANTAPLVAPPKLEDPPRLRPPPRLEADSIVYPPSAADPASSVKPGSGKSFWDTLADGKPCPMCPEMVVVPSGGFTMGSPSSEEGHSSDEAPRHNVTIAKPFAVGRYAVTFDEWDVCFSEGGCKTKADDSGWGRGRRPVINVSWDDVTKEFLPWLNKKTGKAYRLLSEAEREYVTRAGTTTPFWWGSSITPTQANYDGTFVYGGGAKGERRDKTVTVDSFQANPWGLYQVHGNVYDWVEDCWHDSYSGAPVDGSAWTAACSATSRRVVRGGAWLDLPWLLRSALRFRVTTVERNDFFGFRVARSLTP